jgi:hypothetical protein
MADESSSAAATSSDPPGTPKYSSGGEDAPPTPTAIGTAAPSARLDGIIAGHIDRIGAFSVGLIGSTAFYGADSQEITEALARSMANQMPGLALVTGGMDGVQDVAGKAWCEVVDTTASLGTKEVTDPAASPNDLWHLLPTAYKRLEHGVTLDSGIDLAERRIVFAGVCPVYVHLSLSLLSLHSLSPPCRMVYSSLTPPPSLFAATWWWKAAPAQRTKRCAHCRTAQSSSPSSAPAALQEGCSTSLRAQSPTASTP